MEGDAKTGAGRPSDYSDYIANSICEMLMDGMSLNRICKLSYMPSRATVYRWILDMPEFQDKYTRAREAQGDFSADYLSDIAEDLRDDKLKADQARVMATIHMWVAARRAPRKYGDQINVNQNTTVKTVTDKPLTREEEQARWLNQFGNVRSTDE